MRNLTQEEVAKYFKENGYELLSEYINNSTKVTIQNIKKEKFDVTFNNFKRGNRPEKRRKNLTQEEVVEYFKEQGYELLSEYVNTRTKVLIRNGKGEEYEVFINNFKKGNRPERKTKKYTQEEVKEIFSEDGYTVAGTYKAMNSVLDVLCNKNHRWKASLARFKKGDRCPFCNSLKIGGMSKGERMVDLS